MRLARRILINLLLLLLNFILFTWYHVAIDFIGLISPISLSGYRSALFFFFPWYARNTCFHRIDYALFFTCMYRYILTLSDHFSKWVEAVAVPTKEAHLVASALYKVYANHSLCALYHIFNVHVYLDIHAHGIAHTVKTDG